jgi:ABC-type Na+ efflux pump permease subunit
MAIVMYGQWVAYSVAEEKSSRVMEVILGAASGRRVWAPRRRSSSWP